MKSFLMGIGLFVAGLLSAATLNVELDVAHGAYSDGELVASRKVVFLVIDRSYSMCEHTLKDGRAPDEALFDSLKMQLNAIPSGAEIHLVPFSAKIWEEVVYKKLDDAVRKKILDFVKKATPSGQTVLYDAQDVALTAAAKIMDADANADVRVLVYTDGKHLTPWYYEGAYKACADIKKKNGRYAKNPSYEADRLAARKKFEEKFHDLVAKPNLEMEYEWLSALPKPEIEMRTKPSISTELYSKTIALKNPLSESEQRIKCQFFIPVTDSCWEEIKGKPLSFGFYVDGKVVSKMIALDQGKQYVKMDWPSLPDEKPGTAQLVFSRLPSGKKFDLKAPKPIVLNVPARGKASVAIESPSKDAVFAVGANVRFAARASEGAEVKWSVDGSGPLAGASINWVAKEPRRVKYSVSASKVGFKPANAEGSFEVIPTGVEIESAVGRHEVGKVSMFRVKKVDGPCQSYAWKVDGRRVPGETGVLKHVFKNSGVHHVVVTAMYKGGIVKESEPLEISVSVAPLIEVILPMVYDEGGNNDQYKARTPIPLLARVEGDLTNVVWQFKLKDEAVEVQTMVKGGKASGNYTLQKGGYYDVTATAKGPAGEKSSTVQIFVKSTEVQVDIKDLKTNQGIETDKEFDLIANVKGPVKSVRWKIIDQATAKSVPFGPSDVSPVRDGQTSIKAKLPIEVCNTSLEVVAEPIFDEKDRELAESVIYSKVVIQAKTNASINYTQETQSLHWKRVKYGSQVTLGVTTSGAIKKDSVAWFRIGSDGKTEESLKQTGESINVDIPDVRGQSECAFDYFAKGLRPDGVWEPANEGQRITIRGCCPCVLAEERERPRIEPPKTNGVVRTSFGLTDAVHVSLGPKSMYEVADVNWDMGDGTVYTNRGVATDHQYKKYGEYTIKASWRCARCGDAFSVTAPSRLVVEKQPAVAKFKMEPELSAYTIKGNIRLIDTSEGDVGNRVWRVNGKEIQDSGNKKEVNDGLPGIPEDRTYTLEVTDMDGKASAPYVVVIRVRYGWLAVFFFIGAGLIIAFAKKVLLGNDLLKMTVKTLLGPRPNLDDLLAAVIDPNVPEFSVKDYLNFWQKIVWMVVSKKPKSLTVPITELLSSDDEEAIRRFGDERLTFSVINDAPEVRYNERRFEYVTPMAWNHRSPYGEDDPSARIRVLRDRSCKDDSKSCLYLLMRLEDSRHWSVIAFWVIVITMIYLVFHLCMRYAI